MFRLIELGLNLDMLSSRLTWTWKLIRWFEQDVQMAERCVEKCLASLFIREMQVKTAKDITSYLWGWLQGNWQVLAKVWGKESCTRLVGMQIRAVVKDLHWFQKKKTSQNGSVSSWYVILALRSLLSGCNGCDLESHRQRRHKDTNRKKASIYQLTPPLCSVCLVLCHVRAGGLKLRMVSHLPASQSICLWEIRFYQT